MKGLLYPIVHIKLVEGWLAFKGLEEFLNANHHLYYCNKLFQVSRITVHDAGNANSVTHMYTVIFFCGG